MSIGIYKITNTLNGHCYIGQSINIEDRWRHHRSYPVAHSQYPLYKAFAKYGIENFTFEILQECSIEQLNELEQLYIKQYNSYGNTGYNQTLGGDGAPGSPVKLSNEDIQEIIDLLKYSLITQREIAQQFGVGEDTISEINTGKTRYQENEKYPIRTNKRQQKYCLDCGAPIWRDAIRCATCSSKAQRVVERPSREELKFLIRTKPFLQIGKQFGVSDNTIRKWCIAENLPTKKSEIKSYSEEDWDKI